MRRYVSGNGSGGRGGGSLLKKSNLQDRFQKWRKGKESRGK